VVGAISIESYAIFIPDDIIARDNVPAGIFKSYTSPTVPADVVVHDFVAIGIIESYAIFVIPDTVVHDSVTVTFETYALIIIPGDPVMYNGVIGSSEL
ncbi:unnamed protein product, partial [marine sediment metagenome]